MRTHHIEYNDVGSRSLRQKGKPGQAGYWFNTLWDLTHTRAERKYLQYTSILHFAVMRQISHWTFLS